VGGGVGWLHKHILRYPLFWRVGFYYSFHLHGLVPGWVREGCGGEI
jgi:hypothetical protein